MGRKYPRLIHPKYLLDKSHLMLWICCLFTILNLVSLFPKLANAQANGSIFLPQQPKQILPPPSDPNQRKKNLKRKRDHLDKLEKKNEKPKLNPKEERNLNLYKDALRVNPMTLMFQVSFLSPAIKVKGDRSNYTVDLTSHFHLFIRPQESKPINQTQFWWGFRLAPFAGSGVYKETPGRYGFLYFGPMFGIGQLSLGQQSSGFDPKKGQAVSDQKFPVRKGWFWMSGIAAQTRNGEIDGPDDQVDKDLNSSKGAVLDSPGLWTEFTYSTVHFGSVGLNYFLGAQAGEEKTFIWLGIGAAGWH